MFIDPDRPPPCWAKRHHRWPCKACRRVSPQRSQRNGWIYFKENRSLRCCVCYKWKIHRYVMCYMCKVCTWHVLKECCFIDRKMLGNVPTDQSQSQKKQLLLLHDLFHGINHENNCISHHCTKSCDSPCLRVFIPSRTVVAPLTGSKFTCFAHKGQSIPQEIVAVWNQNLAHWTCYKKSTKSLGKWSRHGSHIDSRPISPPLPQGLRTLIRSCLGAPAVQLSADFCLAIESLPCQQCAKPVIWYIICVIRNMWYLTIILIYTFTIYNILL